jgi:hypothetical protein
MNRTFTNKGNEKLIEKWEDVLLAKGKWAGKLDNAPKIRDAHMGLMANVLETSVYGPSEEISEATLAGDVTGYNKVLIPMLRRSVPATIALDMFGVQPMNAPTGLIFSLRATYQNDSVNTLKRPASVSVILTLADATGFTAGTDIVQGGTSTGTGNGVVRHVEGNNVLVETQSGTWVAGAGEQVDDADPYVAAVTTISAVYDNEIAFPYIFTNYTGPQATATAEALTTNMKEVGFQVDSATVTAQSRKLKAKYTHEVEEDFQALHGMSASSVLTQIATDEITLEINREHINLVDTYATTGGTTAWDYSSGPDGRWERELYENLRATINRTKLAVAAANKRGSANFAIVSPNVLAALESSGQIAQDGVDVAAQAFRGVYQGMKIFVDLYATSDYINLGYKGANNEMDAGAYFAPYKPIVISKGFGEEDGQPRLFFRTRYGTATNPFGVGNYFRKITVANLPT